MAVPLDAVHGLDGPLRIGDRVDVLAGFGTDSAGIGIPVVKKLLSDALVLRLGTAKGSRRDSGGAAAAASSAASSLRVPATARRRTSRSRPTSASIWIVARPGAGAEARPDELVTIESVLFGKDADPASSRLGGGDDHDRAHDPRGRLRWTRASTASMVQAVLPR